MKKSFTTISFFFVFAVWQFLCMNTVLLAAETIHEDNNNPDVKTTDRYSEVFFENPDYDFGKIYKGQKVEHIFKFENRGDASLEIHKIKTSCGCTAAILSNNTILPGEAGEIKATFMSGSYSGETKKSISVLSNDPKRLKYVLTISGEIIEDVIIKPKNMDFGSIYIGEKTDTKIASVTVSSQQGVDFKIEEITPSRPFITASMEEEPDGVYIIKATLRHNDEIGRFSGSINLKTNSQMQKNVYIPFFGEIVGDITTYPRKVYFGTVKSGNELSQRLFVKINNNKTKILEMRAVPDFVSTRIIEKRETDNPHYLIEVIVRPDAAIGKINGRLEFYTNSTLQPVIVVPVMGEIEKA